ncbi:MAG: hypothetical protein U9Q92_04785 [archaeon]|nr:hypothetical protein [archaeon]
MKKIMFLAISVMLISGCVNESEDIEDARISLNNVSVDKAVYHSSEVVNLVMEIYSSTNAQNVTVTAKGIGGRFNKRRVLNLTEGVNELSFAYKLPRCNVCGGIREGKYNLSCEVISGSATIKDYVTVDILQ